MSNRKHIPPSRKRYEQENPTISVRLGREFKEMLDEVRGETSYSLFIKELLQQQKGKIKRAYNAGYKKAEDEWKVWFHCTECGIEFYIPADDDDEYFIMMYDLFEEKRVVCRDCADDEE